LLVGNAKSMVESWLQLIEIVITGWFRAYATTAAIRIFIKVQWIREPSA